MRCLPILALLLAGCGPPSSGPPAAQVAATRDVGALAFAPSVKGRDGGHSAWFGDRSVWAFGDTPLAVAATDGTTWRNSTWSSTMDHDASDGLGPFIEPLDQNGAPYSFIPWTSDEAAYNATVRAPACTSDCAPPWVIWPGDVVVDPDRGTALVFYMKQRDWVSAGKSIATWQSPADPVVRPIVAPGSDEPTMLFPAGDFEPVAGALLDGGWLYAYDCDGRCTVGRAPIADALTRSAWTFFAGDGRWSQNVGDAAAVFDGPSIVSLHRNGYLGKLVALYSGPDHNLALRTADAPEGPWSDALDFGATIPPSDGSALYDAIAHADLALDGGRRIYVSYSRGTAPFASEMRLLEVTFR